MLHFSRLHTLRKHTTFLSPLLWEKNFFVVGGAVRDLLLWITTDPTDIDLTLAADPDQLRDDMPYDDSQISRFRTEKFGTMTIIPKDTATEYEITPFRTESWYEDHRHPDTVTRSNNLIDDACRRDFTINCLYRHSIKAPLLQGEAGWGDNRRKITYLKNTNKLRAKLEQHKKNKTPLVIIDNDNENNNKNNNPETTNLLTQTLILQDHDTIADIYAWGDTHISTLLEAINRSATYTSSQSESLEMHSSLSIVIDPHGWLIDMLKRSIQTVGEAQKRFTEDALRIVRGIRFANTLNQDIPQNDQQNSGFDINKQTRNAMTSHSHLVTTIAYERLWDEIVKVFKKHNPYGYIALIEKLWLLSHIFPAVAHTQWNVQPIRYHPFDTYNHTLLTLHALQWYHIQHKTHKQRQSTRSYTTALAMLYHDVGKPAQYAQMETAMAENPDDPNRALVEHHTDSGTHLAKKDLSRLTIPKKDIEEICRYIKHHHRPGEILQSSKKKQLGKIRKLLSEWGLTRCLRLLDIAIADRLGQLNPLQPPAITQLEQMKETLITLDQQEGRFHKEDLAVRGWDILSHYNISPGPLIWEILTKIFERVIVDTSTRNIPIEIYRYIDWLDIMSLSTWKSKKIQ